MGRCQQSLQQPAPSTIWRLGMYHCQRDARVQLYGADVKGEIVRNNHRFKQEGDEFFPTECWGVREKNYTYIIKNVFDQMCRDCNYNGTAFLKWADLKGLIQCNEGRKTKKKKINGASAWTVCLKNMQEIEGFNELDDDF